MKLIDIRKPRFNFASEILTARLQFFLNLVDGEFLQFIERNKLLPPARKHGNFLTIPDFFDADSDRVEPRRFSPDFNAFEILLLKAKRQHRQNAKWDRFLFEFLHFATVGTFVPTDVDLAIRSKLWQTVQNDRHLGPLFENVQEFKTWDDSPVSKRFVFTPSGRKLSGHQGEWFTIAMAAYAVSKKVTSEFLPEAREQIEAEVKNQELALTELKETFLASPTVEAAKAYFAGMSAVAHNLGDLDRLFDLWEIDDTDVLKRRVYRLGHADARAPKPVFLESGRIYQTMLANENHRHFALREPKCLRRSSALLLPFGPFFDDWGMNLVKDGVQTGLLSEGDLRDVAEALILGWKKLNANSIYHSQGYSRALFGIAKAMGKREDLVNLLPPVLKKELNEGGLRTLMNVSQSEFEKKWMVRLKTELTRKDE